jgi:hypothetical protein
MPQGLGGWFYILFFGYYPIVKEKVEKLSKPVSWFLKLLVFNTAITIYAIISYFLFFGEFEMLLAEFSAMFGGMEVGAFLVVAVYAILNLVFVIYDLALTKLITLYFLKLRKKFRF